MLLLNVAHVSQLAQYLMVAEMVRVMDIPAQLDTRQPFAPRVRAWLDGAVLTPVQPQTDPLPVNLPSLNSTAVCMLAELHSRVDHVPAIVRLRKVADCHSHRS